jgi:hypothetical protein
MKRIMAVVVIGVLATLLLGVDEVSGSGQDREAREREARREQISRRLAGLRAGSTVSIERYDGTKIDAVIQDIGPDAVTVLVQESRRDGKTVDTGVATQTIAIDDIRNIREVSVGRMSRSSKALIVAAVAAGLVVLVGVCASSISA